MGRHAERVHVSQRALEHVHMLGEVQVSVWGNTISDRARCRSNRKRMTRGGRDGLVRTAGKGRNRSGDTRL